MRIELLLLLGPALLAPLCSAEEVQTADALAVADLVYRMELEGGRVALGGDELAERRARLAERRVRFVDGTGELRGDPPADEATWLYAVTYQPSGFVLVAGRDAQAPVLAFSLQSELRWGERGQDFMRHHVDTCLLNARRHEHASRHHLWDELLERAASGPGEPGDTGPEDGPGSSGGGGGSVYSLHETAPWAQSGSYNDTAVAMNGGVEVPVGCTATAMAITMQYFQWPQTGSGLHCYSDSDGDVEASHCANFGAHVYDWSAMPAESISAANDDVADLMYHCGVAVEMNYESGGSGAWPSATAMNSYFRYNGTIEVTSGHAAALKKSVLAGLVVVCSSSAHTIVVDGYRDDVAPYFHMNVGWGGTHGWYDIDAGFPASDKSIDRSYPYGAPENHGYVDASSQPFWPLGTVSFPYVSVAMAEAAIPSGGEMFIMGGTYNESLVLDRPMVIRPYSTTNSTPGSVVIQGAP